MPILTYNFPSVNHIQNMNTGKYLYTVYLLFPTPLSNSQNTFFIEHSQYKSIFSIDTFITEHLKSVIAPSWKNEHHLEFPCINCENYPIQLYVLKAGHSNIKVIIYDFPAICCVLPMDLARKVVLKTVLKNREGVRLVIITYCK